MRKRFVIALEGIDGSGKTTQCKMLRDYLRTQGIKARPVGRRFIGSTLLAIIFGAEVIIADRYIHTIKVYFRHKGIKNKLLNGLINLLPQPKLLFYFDLDVDSALKRIAARGNKPDKYETEEGLILFYRGYEAEFSEDYIDFGVHRLNAIDTAEQLHYNIARITSSALSDTLAEQAL